jgi:hypothetical protein
MINEGKNIQQVEINTISSGLTSISNKTQNLHQFLINRCDFLKKYFNEKNGELIIKNSHEKVPELIIKAHHLHKKGYFS